MDSSGDSKPALRDAKADVRIKLSALWVTLMLIYANVDIIGFFEPGLIEGILEGKVWLLDITQTWALSGLVIMTIPALMVFLCLVLPARADRWANIIVGVVYIVVSVGSAIGESWAYMWLGAGVETVVLVGIIWYAVKWPRQGASE